MSLSIPSSDPLGGAGGASASASNPNNQDQHQYQQSSILSEKVTRALQVRTDTPAMRAALEALAHMPLGQTTTVAATAGETTSGSSAVNNVAVVDSRSVRVAIERDALHQAVLLRTELGRLVGTVRELRVAIDDTADLARRVRSSIHSSAVVASDPSSKVLASGGGGDSGGGEEEGQDTDGSGAALSGGGAEGSAQQPVLDSMEQEQRLAAVLHDAFVHRDIARQRLDAVHAFLETFDLSRQDSRLLDHYNFEDVDVDGSSLGNDNNASDQLAFPNGVAFLRALERVRNIRKALAKTFGDSGSGATASSSTAETALAETSGGGGGAGLGASSALRMMENLAQKQERAYERLYHWLQKYLHAFSGGDGGSSNPQDYDDERLDVALQHAFVQRALYTLRHVPAFYSHTLELISSSRRTEETRRFLLALTSGYAGMSPLELKSHDSVAYIGDMLAFAFQAFSVEADVAKGLLLYVPDDEQQEQQESKDEGDGDSNDEEAAAADEEDDDDNDEEYFMLAEDRPMTACDMLAVSMSGLARPLKSRILQVLSTLARHAEAAGGGIAEDELSDDGMMDDDLEEEGAAVRNRLSHLYDICGLLLFYRSAVQKGVDRLDHQQSSSERKSPGGGSSSRIRRRRSSKHDAPSSSEEDQQQQSDSNPLLACLNECLVEGTKAYEATVRVYCARLEQLSAMTGDSEAALAHSLLVLLADVRVHSPGLMTTGVECPPECQRTMSVEWVTETLTEAALATCKTLDDTVVLKQLVSVSKKAGMSVLAAEILDEMIDRKELELIDQLVQIESAKVLDLCGLGSLAGTWMRWQDQQQADEDAILLMAMYPGLSPEEVENCVKEFYASLYSPPLPSLETVIKDPVLRKTARIKIAQKVCEVYGDLYASVLSSGKGGYDDVSFLGHTPDQVKTLFSA